MQSRLKTLLNENGLIEPSEITETNIAWLIRVWCADTYTSHVLKIYKAGHPGNERAGLIWLTEICAASGPAVRVKELAKDAFLMEDLGEHTLGDQLRTGEVAEADYALAQVAQSLHAGPDIPHAGLPKIEDWMQALFDLRFAGTCPDEQIADMRRAAEIGRALISSTQKSRALHGDLHHDNVMLGPRGPTVIDAKGVIADLGYELANALRNPKGIDAKLRDPELLSQRIALFSGALGIPPLRFSQWGAVKTAMSMVWRSKDPFCGDSEADLLAMMLAAVERLSTSRPS